MAKEAELQESNRHRACQRHLPPTAPLPQAQAGEPPAWRGCARVPLHGPMKVQLIDRLARARAAILAARQTHGQQACVVVEAGNTLFSFLSNRCRRWRLATSKCQWVRCSCAATSPLPARLVHTARPA